MGSTCKKPSRLNTTRAVEFVANVLVHVHSDMNVILKDASVLPALNCELQGRDASLISRYEFDARHRNVKVYMSSVKLRNAFGKPAEAIWRKLFIRLNPGGRSLQTGQAYDSCWVLNAEAERRFLFSKQRFMAVGGITPERLLAVLDDIEEKIVAPTDYIVLHDSDMGFKRIQGVDKRVMTRDRHRELLVKSKGTRAQVDAHNRRLGRAMRDQQTFYPSLPRTEYLSSEVSTRQMSPNDPLQKLGVQ